MNLESSLLPTKYIDSDHGAIKEVVASLNLPADSPKEAAAGLFYFVRDQIRYNPFAPMMEKDDYVASTILKRGFGYCVQKAILLAALSRSAGIPCNLWFADIRSHIVPGDLLKLMGTNLFVYHGYNAFRLDDKWIKATAAFDRSMCEKHGYRTVEFDGTTDAVLHPKNTEGKPHIEYVRDRGMADDVPFDDIFKTFMDVYVKNNPNLIELWNQQKNDL